MTENKLIEDNFKKAFDLFKSTKKLTLRIITLNERKIHNDIFLESPHSNEKEGFAKRATNWEIEYEFNTDGSLYKAKVVRSFYY